MTGPKMGVGEPGAFERMNARDREWMDALVAEFKIGGAMLESDRKWVNEKTTVPERWARIVRVAITPRTTKLHDYQEAPPVDLSNLSQLPAPTDVLVLPSAEQMKLLNEKAEALEKPKKRELADVMKRLRPLLEGNIDMAEFNDLESSVAFAPPEGQKMFWRDLCQMLEDMLPVPSVNSPQWVREVADIISGRK